MVEAIAYLSKYQLHYIINEFNREHSNIDLSSLSSFTVKPSKIKYDWIRIYLSELWLSSQEYQNKIKAWIQASIENSDKEQVIAMDPVSGAVSIAALLVFYKSYLKTLEAVTNRPSAAKKVDFPHMFSSPDQTFSQKASQIYRDYSLKNLRHDLVGPEGRNQVDVLILTIVKVEHDAVLPYLNSKSHLRDEYGTNYTLGNFKGIKIALRRNSAQGNISMALEADRGIQFLNPKIVLLIGMAAGLKKVKKSDVVIATASYYYESGKETTAGFKFRPRVGAFNFELRDLAIYLAENRTWLPGHNSSAQAFDVKAGPVVTGEKVVTTPLSKVIQDVDRHCEDAIALSMEGFGLVSALDARPGVKGLEIRGISDIVAHGNKDQIYFDGSRETAAQNASAFAFDFLSYLQQFGPLSSNP